MKAEKLENVGLERLSKCSGFQWDEGNSEKNWIAHRVARAECEQAFLNRPLVVDDDRSHSQYEPRFYALGRTDEGRNLFIVFTVRNDLIRVITARDMNRAERRIYSEKEGSEVRK